MVEASAHSQLLISRISATSALSSIFMLTLFAGRDEL